MCRRPGARITPAAPYALHCSPAASSFAGSQALATAFPSAFSGTLGMIALRGRHHPIAPVFGDDGHPVAGEIDRRRCLGVAGAPALLALAAPALRGQRRNRQREDDKRYDDIARVMSRVSWPLLLFRAERLVDRVDEHVGRPRTGRRAESRS